MKYIIKLEPIKDRTTSKLWYLWSGEIKYREQKINANPIIKKDCLIYLLNIFVGIKNIIDPNKNSKNLNGIK